MPMSSQFPAPADTPNVDGAETAAVALGPSASTTGIWYPEAERSADFSPARQAASAGFEILADGLPPIPLCAHRTHDTWGADAVGRGLGLLGDLHVDRTSFGWRLTGASGKDERLESAGLREAFDVMAEYGEGYTGRVLLSLPGPWSLVTALSLSSGAPVLADHGARRDVIESYALGVAEFCRQIGGLGFEPVIRFSESRLRPVLTGTWPTVSGFGSLRAISETEVYGALSRTVAALPPVLFSLPDLSALVLQGKSITAGQILKASDAAAVSVPLYSLDSRGWEQMAMIAEAGLGTWLHVPETAGADSSAVMKWREAIVTPWTKIGMGRSTVRDFGVLAGPELPLEFPPFLGHNVTENLNRGHMMIAAGLRRALEEIE